MEHHEHKPVHHRKQTFAPIHIIIAVLIGVVLIVNAVQIHTINKFIESKQPPAPELPDVQATIITADCDACADLGEFVDQLKSSGAVTVTKTKTIDAEDAGMLLQEYNITRLPALVLTGETKDLALPGLDAVGDALVLQASASYYDVTSASVRGIVDVQIVLADPAVCVGCANYTDLIDQLKAVGVAIGNVQRHAPGSADAMRIIEAYALTKVPSVVFSADLEEYPFMVAQWKDAGDVAPDGSYVLRTIQPPYYDLEAREVRGAVTFIGISDSTCAACYNLSMHKAILANFGLRFASEKTFDVASSDGANLVKQYNITSVPTMILTGDQALYPALAQVWVSVGSVEKDGAYVFRRNDLMQGATYKDLVTGKVQEAGPAEA